MVIQTTNDQWARVIEGLGESFAQGITRRGEAQKKQQQNALKNAQQFQKDIWTTIDKEGKNLFLTQEQKLRQAQRAFEIANVTGLDPSVASRISLQELETGKPFDLSSFLGAEGQRGEEFPISSVASQRAGEKPAYQGERNVRAGIENFDPNKDIDEYQYGELQRLNQGQFDKLSRDQQRKYFARLRETDPVGRGFVNGLLLGQLEKQAVNLANKLEDKTGKSFGLTRQELEKQSGSAPFAGGEVAGDIAAFAGFSGGLKALGQSFKALRVLGYTPSTLRGRIFKSGLEFGTYGALSEAAREGKVSPSHFTQDFFLGAAFHGLGAGGKKLLGKVAQNIAKATTKAKVGKTGQAAILAGAEKAGIDLEAAYKGDSNALRKLTQYTGSVAKESPQNIKATVQEGESALTGRVSEKKPTIETEKTTRIAREAEPSQFKEREKVREEQIRYEKESPRVREEVKAEEARKTEQKEKQAKTQKRESTLAKEKEIRDEAKEKLPKAQNTLKQTTKELGRAKDELSLARKQKASAEKIRELENTVDRLKGIQAEDREAVKALNYEKRMGKGYKTDKQLAEKAYQDAENVAEKIENLSMEELKTNKLDELAKGIERKRIIPGESRRALDTQDRVNLAFLKAYEKKLAQVNKFLEEAGGKFGEDIQKLRKSKQLLEKLVNQHEKRLRLGRRRGGLRELGKTAREAREFPTRFSKEAPTETKQVKFAGKESPKREAPKSQSKEEKVKKSLEEQVKRTWSRADPKVEKATEDTLEKFYKDKRRSTTFTAADKRNPLRRMDTELAEGIFKASGIKIPPYAISLVRKVAFGTTTVMSPTIARNISDSFSAFRLLTMNPDEQSRYKSKLRQGDIPVARIKKIEKYAEKFKKVPVIRNAVKEKA